MRATGWLAGVALAALVVACGEAPAAFGDGDGWLTSSSSGVFGGGSGGTGGASSSTGGGEEGGGEAGEVEIDAFRWGEAQVTPGMTYDGQHGFSAVVIQGDEETPVCEVTWSVEQLSVPSDCTSCSFAFELRYHAVTVVEDIDDSCQQLGFDAANVENVTEILGFDGATLVTFVGGQWLPDFDAEAELLGGEFFFERYVELSDE